MVMKRKNEDEEELDVSKAAKLDPPPEEVTRHLSYWKSCGPLCILLETWFFGVFVLIHTWF